MRYALRILASRVMKHANCLQGTHTKSQRNEQDIPNNALVCWSSEGEEAGGHACMRPAVQEGHKASERASSTCHALPEPDLARPYSPYFD